MTLDKVKIVRREHIDIAKIFEEIRSLDIAKKCGAIVSFTGIIRGIGHDGSNVKKVIYECDYSSALNNLNNIRERLLEKYPDVKELFIYHVIDEMNVNDISIHIIALSGHRKQAFRIVEEAIDLIKRETPIWKKEITEKGEYWISEKEVIQAKK
ncbi:MAG: molybdenum cofactor biosynthesis protein MoaE [Candidatus Asgardarchaeia archaeon]